MSRLDVCLAVLLLAAACGHVGSVDVPQCGRQKVGANRIIGGTNANRGQWPWQVLLIQMVPNGYSQFCGGTLISNQWVLTAAHCFNGKALTPNSYRVVLGEHNTKLSEGTEIQAPVAQIIRHPQYVQASNLNDITLIKLSQPINLSVYPYINAACLPKATDVFVGNPKCVSTGWGLTQSKQPASILQVVNAALISHTDCRKYFASVTDATKICFGNGAVGACFGDSGGPLACTRSDGAYVVAGVVSFGTQSCTQQPFPTVYSNVAAYRSWIASQTGL